MAKIVPRTLKFTPSTSPDVVLYRVRIADVGTVDYDTTHDEITDLTTQPDGKIHYDLSTHPLAPSLEGTYDVGVTSVDGVGNESDISIISGVALDFTAPDAPTALEVV